ncbi:MAG: DUF3131 domain-containing protein [Hyphomicrobiaceae bacterium]
MDTPLATSLKRDAEIAWQYFATRAPGAPHGLVPAAMWPEGTGLGRYNILTMWDAGSLILAYLSARSIGLIDEKEFDQRMRAVMAFLRNATFRWGPHALPNYRTQIIGGNAVEGGYDTTDTGRLLAALHILDKVTNGAYRAKEQVARWDIAAMVNKGQPYDVKSSARFEARCFNYVHYIARAYAFWDIEVDTRFNRELRPGDTDARQAFIDHVAAVGPIASEPHTNEAIELGHSPRSQILADALDAAQKARYAETGRLTSVSESPIDKQPWFTYQGYNLDAYAGPRWPVDAVVTEKRWATPQFAETFRMISSKAAYLWLAERGDTYATKLRNFIAAKAPSGNHGFYPGIYEASGRPPRIMDVNTNAAVLESIAFILADRKPLVEMRL